MISRARKAFHSGRYQDGTSLIGEENRNFILSRSEMEGGVVIQGVAKRLRNPILSYARASATDGDESAFPRAD